MYFLRAINRDRQTRLLNVLGQIAMILGDKKKPNSPQIVFPIRILSTHSRTDSDTNVNTFTHA